MPVHDQNDFYGQRCCHCGKPPFQPARQFSIAENLNAYRAFAEQLKNAPDGAIVQITSDELYGLTGV